MSGAQKPKRRNVEAEEPLDGLKVVKGPAWLRRIFVNGDRGGN